MVPGYDVRVARLPASLRGCAGPFPDVSPHLVPSGLAQAVHIFGHLGTTESLSLEPGPCLLLLFPTSSTDKYD